MDKHEIINTTQIKLVDTDFEVEFNIEYVKDTRAEKDLLDIEIENGISEVSQKIEINDNKIKELNKEIERLTNHADGLDYLLAVSSGIIAGLIDIFVVGEWNFQNAKAISNEQINKKIQSFAENQGYKDNGKGLKGAVEFLEKKFPLPGDNSWKVENIGISAKSHHLDDFSHHPTFIGLIFSVLSQFTKTGFYSNSEGEFIKIPLIVNEKGEIEGKTPVAKVGAGIINWFFNVARNRKGHLFSDMAGSKQTAGGGMGIPGSIMSTLKELSSLPGFRDTEFPKKLAQAYKNGIGQNNGQLNLGIFNNLFEGASSKMDIRTEIAILHELKRQALPVMINEIVVRSFYFIRRLIIELKEKKDLNFVEWKKVLPFNNRTIARMLSISTGTFTLIDLGDAAIRGAIKSGGNLALFAKEFILRVNFVGVGRLVLAVGVDVSMGIKREKSRNERIVQMSQQLHLMDAKIFYFQANMWIAAETTYQTIEDLKGIMEKTALYAVETWEENRKSINNIGNSVEGVKIYNPELVNNISEILKWE